MTVDNFCFNCAYITEHLKKSNSEFKLVIIYQLHEGTAIHLKNNYFIYTLKTYPNIYYQYLRFECTFVICSSRMKKKNSQIYFIEQSRDSV